MIQDFRHALRKMWRGVNRAPGLTACILLTVGTGVAALTATFSVVDAALWRPPPFADADQIDLLMTTHTTVRDGTARRGWSYAAIQLLRREFSAWGLVANFTGANLTLTSVVDPQPLKGEIVSPEYFTVLRASPARGRALLASDDIASNPQSVVVISHELWVHQFGADPQIIGRAEHFNGHALTIVGVMQPGFRGLSDEARFWIPTALAPQLTYPEYVTTTQFFINVVARRNNGVAAGAATAAMELIGPRIDRELNQSGHDPTETIGGTLVPLNQARIGRLTQRSALTLFAAVALLDLLACVNVINLLLGQAARRQREIAVRAAIGGGPGMLVWHAASGALALSSIAGLTGLALAAWALHQGLIPPNTWGGGAVRALAPFATPTFDGRTLLFGIALVVFTILCTALGPALTAARVDILSSLRAGSRGVAFGHGTLRRPSLRGGIVALEAALAMLLLIGGGLMIDSFARMRRADLGVDANHVLTFWLIPPEAVVAPKDAPQFVTRMIGAISSVPGVEAVTVDGGSPVSGSASNVVFIQGRPVPAADNAPPVLRHYVAPDHFKVLGIPLIRGRVFTSADNATGRHVAVISQSAARHFWPDQEAIGQHVWFASGSGFASEDSSAEIVGIVGDVRNDPLDRPANRDEFYTPYLQFTYAARAFFVRTQGDPLSVVSGVRGAVHSVNPDLPLVDLRTLNDLIGNSWSRQRFDATLFGGLAALALLLASTGVYAVVAFAVGQRTREMGIRMALGAHYAEIIRLVLREGLQFPLVGVVIGGAAAVALTGLMRSLLYEVTPTDPFVLGGAAAILIGVAMIACFIPGQRAARVDPVTALRADG